MPCEAPIVLDLIVSEDVSLPGVSYAYDEWAEDPVELPGILILQRGEVWLTSDAAGAWSYIARVNPECADQVTARMVSRNPVDNGRSWSFTSPNAAQRPGWFTSMANDLLPTPAPPEDWPSPRVTRYDSAIELVDAGGVVVDQFDVTMLLQDVPPRIVARQTAATLYVDEVLDMRFTLYGGDWKQAAPCGYCPGLDLVGDVPPNLVIAQRGGSGSAPATLWTNSEEPMWADKRPDEHAIQTDNFDLMGTAGIYDFDLAVTDAQNNEVRQAFHLEFLERTGCGTTGGSAWLVLLLPWRLLARRRPAEVK